MPHARLTCSCFLCDWHKNARDLHLDGTKIIPVREIERLPVIATERYVRSLWPSVHDAAELLALRVENVHSACPSAVNIASDIHLHAIRPAGLRATKVRENAIRLLRYCPIRCNIERADETSAEIGYIEDAFVRRKREPVREHKVVGEKSNSAKVGGDPVNSGIAKVPLLNCGAHVQGIAKVNGAIRFHDHIVRNIELLALEAICNHSDAAIRFLPRDTPRHAFASNESTLQVPGETIRAIDSLLGDGSALTGDVFHTSVVMNVTVEKIAAFLPPKRPFCRSKLAASA